MICEYITRYLLLNKRLVVPNLGAFVVNPSNGDLIFVELLKQDDGVLMRQLMADGLSAVDAMNMIDRFVFEIRHKPNHGCLSVRLPDFCELKHNSHQEAPHVQNLPVPR